MTEEKNFGDEVFEQSPKYKEYAKRIEAAQHRCQAGAAALIPGGHVQMAPKFVRNGLDMALCEHAAMFNILRRKGLITLEEYMSELADVMEAEAESYRERCQSVLGTKITLV